ncbi:MAG: carbohydrate ABC transporter permease [Clostridiales bacterium]|nr:carbohydrate ABC transporter permease [Clostridiales bacterium]
MDKQYQNEKTVNRLNQIKHPTNLLFNSILLFFALACFLPFIVVLLVSITEEASISRYGYQLIPQAFSGQAYLFLWKERAQILNALLMSLITTSIGTVLGVLLTSVLGYVMSRPGYRLKGFLTWMVFIPMIFNGGMVASYVINVQLLQFRNGLHALILPLMVGSFNVVICKTFFRTTIPDSIVESAKIDGAGQLRIYFNIVLPISKPVLATMALFLSFGYWNDWFLSLLYITDNKLYTLQYLLQQIVLNVECLAKNPGIGSSLQGYIDSMPRESVRMAIAVIIVLPIALAYPFFQKYFISGLTIGAVKG